MVKFVVVQAARAFINDLTGAKLVFYMQTHCPQPGPVENIPRTVSILLDIYGWIGNEKKIAPRKLNSMCFFSCPEVKSSII
jgi:hypothetical protein